jgi:oligopeptide transport system permease protein
MRPGSKNLIREFAVFLIFVWIVLTALFISSRLVPQFPIQLYIYKCMCVPDGEIPSWIIHYALDRGIVDQYFAYLGSTVTGEFGVSSSVFPGMPVNSMIWGYLLKTLLVVGSSLIAALLVARAFVRIRAAHINCDFLAIARMSTPALIAAVAFGFLLQYCLNPFYGLDQVSSFNALLSFLCLTIGGSAYFVNKGEEFLEEPIREGCASYAQAKGVKDKAAVEQCVKISSSAGFIGTIPFAFAWMLSADMIMENIFTYNGLGKLVWEASKTEIDIYLLHTALWMIMLMVLIVYFAMRIASYYVKARTEEKPRRRTDYLSSSQ